MNAINTEKAPKAIGPYSQAIAVGGFLYVSGQLPTDPRSGGVVMEDIDAQTRRALENIKNILEEAGMSMEQVVKTTIFLKDMYDFPKVNSIYAQFFGEPYPARSCVEVARLPKDVLVEIEAVAYQG